MDNFQTREHLPNGSHYDWSICMNTGSMDALFKAFEMLVDRGQSIIVENPSFPGSLSAMKPRGLKLIGKC
jgi:kynurenine/2-aminoadipate aminotransferase